MSINVSNEIVTTADGKHKRMSDFKGDVLLIVNVASKCGHTPQYAGLEALHQKYAERGFKVLGFPCNQFGGQEPGTMEEIQAFCSSKYNVTFPIFQKIDVNGANRTDLYSRLTVANPQGDVAWNFEKFLIARDGSVIGRFKSRVAPDSPELVDALEQALV